VASLRDEKEEMKEGLGYLSLLLPSLFIRVLAVATSMTSAFYWEVP
jgi:hypothetical protein